jgi:predicted nucleic acid-binding protein
MRILVDTCVWLAIFDPTDSTRDRATVADHAAKIQSMTAIIPWPITYETMSSKFAKNSLALHGFEKHLKSTRILFLDDAPYREKALEHALDSSLKQQRPLSLTDCLLRVVVDELGPGLNYLATYNVKDFSDVCKRKKIEILC